MIDAAATWLLDVTRTVAREGHGAPTGIDRVENAYLSELSARPEPFFALFRDGVHVFLVEGSDFLRLKGEGRAALRDGAAGRAYSRRGIAKLVEAVLPGTRARYLNVGHTNLAGPMLPGLAACRCLDISVMIHDTIPLDLPQLCRRGTRTLFRARLRSALRYADRLICNSQVTEADLRRWAGRLGFVPPSTLVARLGIETAKPEASLLPRGLPLNRPYYVILGTIEPRKNHALLLDVWAHLTGLLGAEACPRLFIVGRRGWATKSLLHRLDTDPVMGQTVFELSGLADGAVTALLAGAKALLFPSYAEGFGLPAVEAAALGTPVIASDLPVFREMLADFPIYLDPGDAYSWSQRIMSDLSSQAGACGGEGTGAILPEIPSWKDHFDLVLREI